MSIDFATLKDWFFLGVVFLCIVVLPLGVAVSLRRNRRDIEAFEHADLTELKLCIPVHQLNWLKYKLGKMGWQLISEEADPKFRNNLHVRFSTNGNGARPLKDVLHSLNRSLALSIGPLNLHREEPQQ